MSGKLMGKVYALKLTRVQRDVLQAICDHAKDDGTGAYPSVAYLAWKCDLSERQTKRVLKQLENVNLIARVAYAKGGRGRSPLYRVNLSAGMMKPPFQPTSKGDIAMSPFPVSKGDISSRKRVTSRSQKGDTQMSPQPSVEPPVKPSHARSRKLRSSRAGREGSKFSRDEVRKFVENLKSKGQEIRLVGAYANSLYESGNADADIEAFINNPEPERKPTIAERLAMSAAKQS